MLSRLLQGSGTCMSAAAVVATTCSSHLQKCWASTSSSKGSSRSKARPEDSTAAQLTPEQQQHLDTLRYLIARPLEAAQNAALLTAFTASYRDLYVVMDQFHKRDILGIPRPLTDEPPPQPSSSQPEQAAQQQQQEEEQPQLNHTQMFYPLRDLTKLPDQPAPPDGFYRHHIQEHIIGSRLAHAHLLANHLEVNYTSNSFIFLWPPMECFYPALFNPGYMLRHLKPHLKRKRVSKSTKQQRVRCSLGWQRNKPYLKQRVFGTPSVPPTLRL